MVPFLNNAAGMCEKIPKNLTGSSELTPPLGHLPTAPRQAVGFSDPIRRAGSPRTSGAAVPAR